MKKIVWQSPIWGLATVAYRASGMTAQISEAFVASDETYGMPRIRAEPKDAGIVASRKRIRFDARRAHARG